MKQKKRGRNRQIVSPAELGRYADMIRPVVEKIVRNLGFYLTNLLFVHENQENYLRLTIMHKDHSVSLDDCEIVSRNVDKELDSLDPIPFSYMLEVQSRGVVTTPLQDIDKDAVQNLRHEFVLEKIGLTVRS